MHGLVRCKPECRFSRVRSGRVIQRYHNRSPRWRMWPGTWVTSRTGSVGWDLKSQLVELSLAFRRRRMTFACSPRPCGGCHMYWWGRWKSQVYLSPYVEKPFNSKVIKFFVPALNSRKCFSCFGIPMFNVYMLWTFMYVSHIRIIGILDLYHINWKLDKSEFYRLTYNV